VEEISAILSYRAVKERPTTHCACYTHVLVPCANSDSDSFADVLILEMSNRGSPGRTAPSGVGEELAQKNLQSRVLHPGHKKLESRKHTILQTYSKPKVLNFVDKKNNIAQCPSLRDLSPFCSHSRHFTKVKRLPDSNVHRIIVRHQELLHRARPAWHNFLHSMQRTMKMTNKL
jgi:hypothetical protein